MLTTKNKQDIAIAYWAGATMESLGTLHGVHRRTIQRVLLAAGVIAPQNRVSESEMNMVRILRQYRMKTSELTQLLQKVYPGVV